MAGRAEVSSDLDAVIRVLGLATKELLADGCGFTSRYYGLLGDAYSGLGDVIRKSSKKES